MPFLHSLYSTQQYSNRNILYSALVPTVLHMYVGGWEGEEEVGAANGGARYDAGAVDLTRPPLEVLKQYPRNDRRHERLLLESDESKGPILMDSHVCDWSIPTCMPFSSCSSKTDKLV